MVKNPPAMWETWVWSLGWEDPLEKKWQPTPVFLPGKSHGQRSLVGYSPWSCRVRYNWATNIHTENWVALMIDWLRIWLQSGKGVWGWRRKWQLTPVLLSGKFHGWRSLIGNSPWGCRVGYDWATSLSFFLWQFLLHLVYNHFAFHWTVLESLNPHSLTNRCLLK